MSADESCNIPNVFASLDVVTAAAKQSRKQIRELIAHSERSNAEPLLRYADELLTVALQVYPLLRTQLQAAECLDKEFWLRAERKWAWMLYYGVVAADTVTTDEDFGADLLTLVLQTIRRDTTDLLTLNEEVVSILLASAEATSLHDRCIRSGEATRHLCAAIYQMADATDHEREVARVVRASSLAKWSIGAIDVASRVIAAAFAEAIPWPVELMKAAGAQMLNRKIDSITAERIRQQSDLTPLFILAFIPQMLLLLCTAELLTERLLQPEPSSSI